MRELGPRKSSQTGTGDNEFVFVWVMVASVMDKKKNLGLVDRTNRRTYS